MPEPIDFFVHIPKTAGTTMVQIMEGQYSPGSGLWMRGTAEEDRSAIVANIEPEKRAMAGHLHYGYARLLPRPCRAFTMLREPVDRLISLYYFIAREKSMPTHERLLRGELTMEKLARRQGSVQARFIAGYGPKDVVPPDDILLAEAKDNLATKMAAVGLTEHFDESLLLYNQALGWSVRGYYRENVTRNRLKKEGLSQEEIEMIRSNSAVDLALYEFARHLFAARIAAQPPEFAQQLAALRRKIKISHGASRVRVGWQLVQRALRLAKT